jgi:DinB superfamily
LGLLADECSGLVVAWNKVETFWSKTIEEASRLPSEQLDTRVSGEWSLIETLRHLIFVTDAWVSDAVLEMASPYDPIGLPPHFVESVEGLGIDLDLRPSLEQVLVSRGQRVARVREAIRETPDSGLDRPLARLAGQFTVLGAFQNVIFEEWAHHYYATRDLDQIR